MKSDNLKICKKEFDERKIKTYWISTYQDIEDPEVARKLFQSAFLLRSNRQANVFCQRAVQDLTEAVIPVDGRFSTETVDAVNFTIKNGLGKQLRQTTAHYVANYIQFQVRPNKYGDYLKQIFD